MKVYIHDNFEEEEDNWDEALCVSYVRGAKVNVPHKLPFSFYFSQRLSSHVIRVKVLFKPDRIREEEFGILELHGDWKFTPGPSDKNVSQEQIREMKQFFRDYKVLFAGVWESELPEDTVCDYFRGAITLPKLLKEFYFYEDYKEEMSNIRTIEELEDFVRDNHIFNMWD